MNSLVPPVQSSFNIRTNELLVNQSAQLRSDIFADRRDNNSLQISFNRNNHSDLNLAIKNSPSSKLNSKVNESNLSTDLKRLDPDEEHRIQIQVLTQKSKKEPCPICLIPFVINPTQNIEISNLTKNFSEYDKVEHLVMTPCKHIFHEECFVAMFKTNPQCPLCRTDLRDMRNDQFVFEESRYDSSIHGVSGVFEDIQQVIAMGLMAPPPDAMVMENQQPVVEEEGSIRGDRSILSVARVSVHSSAPSME